MQISAVIFRFSLAISYTILLAQAGDSRGFHLDRPSPKRSARLADGDDPKEVDRTNSLKQEKVPCGKLSVFNVDFLEAFVDTKGVCIDDTRTPVKKPTKPEEKATFCLEIKFPKQQVTGTGVLVGKRLILTAGHNVFLTKWGGWAESISIIPGGLSDPCDSDKTVLGKSVKTVSGWVEGEDKQYDYAAILLDTDELYNPVKWLFPLAIASDEELQSTGLWTLGYPRDDFKPLGSLWKSDPELASPSEKLRIFHTIDTEAGSSGGALIFNRDKIECVGIHTYGGCEIGMSNSGTRLTASRIEKIKGWNPKS